MSPLLLSLECSTQVAGVALYRGTDELALQTWTRQTTHGEHLTPSVEMLFQLTHLKISDIDAIAVGIGPGSFTGVRIAVNTAKSLANALQKPVMGFSTLQLLAQNEIARSPRQPNTRVISVMDALNGFFYSAQYVANKDSLIEIVPPHLSSAAEIEFQIKSQKETGPPVVCGDFPAGNMERSPNVQSVATLALRYFLTGQTLNWNELAPLYIRASSAEEKLSKTNERAKTSNS